MNKRLKLYKEFIDNLTQIKGSALVNWVKEKGWPDLPENEKHNQLLKKLSANDKEILSEMIQESRDSGIHDTLAYLSEQINLKDLKLTYDNLDMAVEPYGTPLHWDWTARCQGDDWPENQLEDEYK